MNSHPKALCYRDALTSIEQRIVDSLPDIVEKLISQAKEGDTKTAIYLCDRILGKAAGLEVVPAEDRRDPLSEEAYLLDLQTREETDREMVNFLKQLGQ